MTKFENKFSEYIATKSWYISSNGSAALDIRIKALNIGKGDEVSCLASP
ncbi:DegT/DnrJ/EryC1/StrS family aminotransferase [Pedobacter jamesrossensis]